MFRKMPDAAVDLGVSRAEREASLRANRGREIVPAGRVAAWLSARVDSVGQCCRIDDAS